MIQKGCDPIVVLNLFESPNAASITALESNCLMWSHGKRLEYNLTPLAYSQEISDMLSSLISAGAFPGAGKTLAIPVHDQSATEVVASLGRMGYVSSSESHGCLTCCLTKSAMNALQMHHRLSSPMPVFSPRAELQLQDRSAWELVLGLEEDGWQLLEFPRRQRDRPSPYKQGGDKVWYVRAGVKTICKDYILALTRVSQGIGTASEVEHGRRKPPPAFPNPRHCVCFTRAACPKSSRIRRLPK